MFLEKQNMRIQLSKTQWEHIGKNAGWLPEKEESLASEKALRHERGSSPMAEEVREKLMQFSFKTVVIKKGGIEFRLVFPSDDTKIPELIEYFDKSLKNPIEFINQLCMSARKHKYSSRGIGQNTFEFKPF